jgi:hypothetical protein
MAICCGSPRKITQGETNLKNFNTLYVSNKEFILLCKIPFKLIWNCLYFTGFFFRGEGQLKVIILVIILPNIELTFSNVHYQVFIKKVTYKTVILIVE